MKRLINQVAQSFSSSKKPKADETLTSTSQIRNGNTITAPMLTSSSDDEEYADGFLVVKPYPPPQTTTASPLNVATSSHFKFNNSDPKNKPHATPLDGVRLTVRHTELSRATSAAHVDKRLLEMWHRGPDFQSLDYNFSREVSIIAESII